MGEAKETRLESGKEIARDLGRTERTVQRWAKQNGLPVYRITSSPLGKMFAYQHELDGWLYAHKNPLLDPAKGSNGHFAAVPPGPAHGATRCFWLNDVAFERHRRGLDQPLEPGCMGLLTWPDPERADFAVLAEDWLRGVTSRGWYWL